jgi:hypothetical protein
VYAIENRYTETFYRLFTAILERLAPPLALGVLATVSSLSGELGCPEGAAPPANTLPVYKKVQPYPTDD